MTTIQKRLEETRHDLLWQAVLQRDPTYDGSVIYAVRTTGIYCRPICPSRRPNRANVRFFADSKEAQSAGYRACLRCLPDRPTKRVAIAVSLNVSAIRSTLTSTSTLMACLPLPS